MSFFNRKQDEIAISEAELNAMTAELDMLHKETFPGVSKTMDEFSANVAREQAESGFARRSFLLGVGGVAVLGGVAACSSSGGGRKTSAAAPSTSASAPAPTSSAPAAGSKYTGDLKVVALAAALENLAVAAYGMAIQAAGSGKLGKVPPAVATFAATVMQQHKDHSDAWNAVLGKANLPKITGTPVSIAADQVKMLQAAKSVVDVAKLALALENAAAETYLFATGNVKDPGGIMTAATIEPVETMHAAILNFVLGQYPIPMSFIGTTNAVMPSALTV